MSKTIKAFNGTSINSTANMNDVIAETWGILVNTLQLDSNTNKFVDSTALLGSVPELDSMMIVSLITAIEDDFNIVIADEEITADIFETFGTLTRFISKKLQDTNIKQIIHSDAGDLGI